MLAVQAALLIWRLLAVGSSLWDPRLGRPGRRDALPIAALLLVAVIVPQAYAGYATEVARETADEIFVGTVSDLVAGPIASAEPDPSFLATAIPSASISASPSATPTVPRVNILLTGVDAGVGRNTYLTDTMIVASLDPVTETVSMVSIPRDMVDVPLPDGRRFNGQGQRSGVVRPASPEAVPGSDGTGFDVLRGALGKLLGLDIPYHAAVNLGGFVHVIDTLGGVDVYVARAFCDPSYDEYGFSRGFAITKGRHHLNGQQALAYARVRKAAGESDFTRAARQQEVLSGIRDRIVHGGFINDPIGLLRGPRQDRHDQRPPQGPARHGRRDGQDRTPGHVPDRHHLAARGLSTGCPRLHTGAQPAAHRDAERGAVPARRDAAEREVPRRQGSARGSDELGRRRLSTRRDPDARRRGRRPSRPRNPRRRRRRRRTPHPSRPPSRPPTPEPMPLGACRYVRGSGGVWTGLAPCPSCECPTRRAATGRPSPRRHPPHGPCGHGLRRAGAARMPGRRRLHQVPRVRPLAPVAARSDVPAHEHLRPR